MLGHWGRHVWAPTGLTVYAGQGLHNPSPTPLYLPAAHCTGADPPSLHAWPSGHMHADWAVDARREKGSVAGHAVQSLDPALVAKVPNGQRVHDPSPARLLCPAAHSTW
jgi:hypothetical protein